MKTKGDTVTCSQAPDLIANMLYQLTIRLPSSGQYAFVERTSNKKTTPPRIWFRYIGGVAFALQRMRMVSDHIVEPGGLVAGHEVGDGVFIQVLLDHLLQALPEGEGPAAGHAVAALVARAEAGHGDQGTFQ